MSRPRKPISLLELSGAFKKNPNRRLERANAPVPTGPLGDPPLYFQKREKEIWFELASIAPPGVLTNMDRWLVELACGLIAKQRLYGTGGRHGIRSGELSALMQCLVKMGMTPSDRSKVSVPGTEKSNPFERFVS